MSELLEVRYLGQDGVRGDEKTARALSLPARIMGFGEMEKVRTASACFPATAAMASPEAV